MERRYVMGVSAGQRGSAALLCNGRVLVAIDEQRITSGEHDAAPGAAAIQYCLDSAEVTWDDITLLVESDVSEKSGRHSSRDLAIPDQIRRLGASRQLAHAYCAATASTFHDATVAVLGGQASGDEDSNAGADRDRRPVENASGDDFAPTRPSYLYDLVGGLLVARPQNGSAGTVATPWELADFHQRVTTYLFGRPTADELLAGLAARGRPGRFAARHGIPAGDGSGRVTAAGVGSGQVTAARQVLGTLDPGRSADNRGEPLTADLEYYADIARWAQDLIGDVVLELLHAWHTRYPSPNLVYAGDLTANTALNRRVAAGTPFEQVFLQPVAGDPGAAVGCCYYGWAEVLEATVPPQHDSDPCFGHRYPANRVAAVAESAAGDPELVADQPEDLVAEVTALLAAGRTVGWYEAGSELGNRTLGHRSVLAAPRPAELGQRLARSLGRPEFTAPAAIVRAEDCAEVFDLPDLSRHQVLSARIRPRWAEALPAVAQADGTAVVQCVTGSSHRRLHQLLAAWSRVNSPPVLLNERLGQGDGTLVETPEQALALLTTTPLDALVLEDRLIRKADRR